MKTGNGQEANKIVEVLIFLSHSSLDYYIESNRKESIELL